MKYKHLQFVVIVAVVTTSWVPGAFAQVRPRHVSVVESIRPIPPLTLPLPGDTYPHGPANCDVLRNDLRREFDQRLITSAQDPQMAASHAFANQLFAELQMDNPTSQASEQEDLRRLRQAIAPLVRVLNATSLRASGGPGLSLRQQVLARQAAIRHRIEPLWLAFQRRFLGPRLQRFIATHPGSSLHWYRGSVDVMVPDGARQLHFGIALGAGQGLLGSEFGSCRDSDLCFEMNQRRYGDGSLEPVTTRSSYARDPSWELSSEHREQANERQLRYPTAVSTSFRNGNQISMDEVWSAPWHRPQNVDHILQRLITFTRSGPTLPGGATNPRNETTITAVHSNQT